MRHIFHQILERYLDSDQLAFDTSPRELWPSTQPAQRRQGAGSGGGIGHENGRGRTDREFESQN